MKEGTVKFFNNSKGFGFIILKDSEDEIFVHKNGLIDRIREKDNVTFDVEQTEKGPSAINVKKV
ncbi:cold shock domain-containing protein [Xanthomarina sp. F1114]|nr:cold shock domain-containing protein [Xanthomarina sp. F1114]